MLLTPVVFLGGDHGKCGNLRVKSAYDLRFMDDKLAVFNVGTPHLVGELPYGDFTNVQIGGPGETQSINPFVDSAGKIIGTAIRATQVGISDSFLNVADSLISAGLKAAGTRSTTKTILAVRTTDSELFFLYTVTEPGQLRIDLSPVLGRIREVLSSARVDNISEESPDVASIIERLGDAAKLLDRGLISREEFDRLKSQLLPGD